MMKRLKFLVGMLLVTLVASAQSLSMGGSRVLPTLPASQQSPLIRFDQAPRFVPRRAPINVDEDRQMWWGYYPYSFVEGAIGYGAQQPETYWGAIAIPASEALPQGKSIKGVRFGLAGTSVMRNLHLWIAEKLPNDLSECIQDIPVEISQAVNQDWTEVVLPQPFTIPNKTVYVGYTFEIYEVPDGSHDSNYPMLIRYNGANLDNSFWVRTSSLAMNWTDENKQYGPLAIQVLLDGDNFPHNAIQISKTFLDVFALVGGKANATVTLTSQGLGEVSNIDYIVGDANADGEEQHLDFEPIKGMGSSTTVRIPLTADATTGRSPRYITVTKVNGVENTIENATSDGYIVSLEEAVERRTVVEEFTGTWCGWCPRGIVGMEQVNKKFGDKAITIVVHSSDPMAINYGISASSYPMAYVDRGVAADPYYGVSGDKPAGICDLVEERNSLLSEASVNLQQPVLAKSGTISFKTEVTFLYDNPKSAPYAIGYVLLQDGLQGKGRNWAQYNNYSGNTESFGNDELLKPWVDAASYVPMTFDHVAIAAKGMDGSGGGFNAPIKKDVLRTLTGSLSISGNEILQDFEKLKVVAILFNTETGYIVNADVKPVKVADDFSQNRMQIKAFEQAGALKGESAKAIVPVANFGRQGVHSIDYVVREGLDDSDTLHIDLPTPISSYGVYEDVEFPLPAHSESGLTSVTIMITKVNGVENEATSGKSAKGSVMTVVKYSKRRTVVEEFTGTWCVWCPRGMAGLKRASVEYPDDAVLMAIHGGRDSEPMKVAAFTTQLNSVSGFPSAHVNRYLTCDPYMGLQDDGFGLGALIESENNQWVEAAVELQQPTMNATTGVINFTTDVTFQINRNSAPYLLSYVLVADGLTGEGDDWMQANAYAAYYRGSYADDPYMSEICNEWDVYANVVFDHVAISANGIDNGVANSLKSTVEEGQTQTHSSKFNTKTNALAKKATKLRVIALLYDKTRKVFINADEKEVVTVDDVSDALTPAAVSPAEIYNLSGQRLGALRRGVNIVGGKKVVVK